MTDAELIARLREPPYRLGFETEDQAKIRRNKEREAAADRMEALIADLARSTRMIAKMVPLSADGNYVFWDGVGDIELDHNGELRKTIEALEAKLGEQNLLWQAYDGDLYQAYVDANEARIDAEAKLAEAVEALEQCEIMLRLRGHDEVAAIARATLAEIKDESHEALPDLR